MEIFNSKANEPVVHIIHPTITEQNKISEQYRQKRVVAYCRVSTKQEEQLNSYDTQVNHYTEKIRSEPKWKFAGIFADKGITGTSVKNRDEFNKMIRYCKRGKVDMIITKSISRFARNTLDCLKYTRLLKELGVDVYFEEQGIHSIKPGAEFYITIYGSIAQSESENISANVKFGKAQSAKEGKAAFHYKNTLGYKKGKDGKPEIIPEDAETIIMIYEMFLNGYSMIQISQYLEEKGISSPTGKQKWSVATVQSILRNEKYAGDIITNKTYTEDCLSKKVKINNGERRKYYIENHHPAIIDKTTFARVQEELARRNSKARVSLKRTKTERGKYSGKYALSEKLICGECNTPYRRCTWIRNGEKRIVWRCVKRIELGKRYCHSSTIDENCIHRAIMNAVQRVANENFDLSERLKRLVAAGAIFTENSDEETKITIKIAEIEKEFNDMLNSISSENAEEFDENRAKQLIEEKNALEEKLAGFTEKRQKSENESNRIEEIVTVVDSLKNHPLEYDDKFVRQLIEKVIVESKERIKAIFKGGLEVEESL